jgi:23S rRNA (cytidine1920-2'-O)/16S rRNA (cytidine1409-2'-O)-methyltransferase
LYQGDAVFPCLVAEVFNTFVENSVENRHSISVSDSPRDASTLCTAASAGTFRVQPASNFLMKANPGKASPNKVRLDKLLVDRGLAASRERAQALILAGKVLVDEQKLEKSGAQVGAESKIRLLVEDLKYVSRGGLKLERALEHWKIDVKDKTCLDVGASTGGFTDCLLRHGAARVIAVDTGYGQMDFKLRQDSRVRLIEKTNARYLMREAVGEHIHFVAMDVSFISAALVLPAVIAVAFSELPNQRHGKRIVVLVKPQFEAGREHVGKGGIVRDEEAQQAAVEKVRAALLDLGAAETDFIDSPILGAEGNREFLLYGVF